jgi:hypothetical protein
MRATRKKRKQNPDRRRPGKPARTTALVRVSLPAEAVQQKIYVIRGLKVMLDADLAELYQVPTGRLNEQVKRNLARFPPDFMIRLTPEEWDNLKSQFAISSWGGRRTLPLAFTEHGVTMLSAVLNSPRAVKMSIEVVRAFVKLREFLASHRELAQRMAVVEDVQKRQASVISLLADEIEQLKRPPVKPKRRIGFLLAASPDQARSGGAAARAATTR